MHSIASSFRVFLLAALCILAQGTPGLSGVVWAQQPVAEAAADGVSETITKARSDLTAAGEQITGLRQQVEANVDDDVKLVDLKAQVDEKTRAVIAISVGLRPRFDAIKSRLTELGEPPAAGQPAEAAIVSDERQQLTAERSLINALTGEAEDLSIKATGLSNSITETRRALFAERLFKRTEISTDVLTSAASSVVTETGNLQRTVGSWVNFAWKFKRIALLSTVFLSLGAALLFLVGGYRLFGGYIRRDPGIEQPTYITRLSVAFWSTMIQTLSLTAFLVTSFFFMNAFNVLRPDIAPMVSSVMGLTGMVYFVWTLTHAVFAPSQPDWRLVRVSNAGARQLGWAALAMTTVIGLDYVLSTISVVLGSPVVLTVIKSLIASLIIAVIVIVISFLRPVMAASGQPEDRGRPWPRGMGGLLRIIGIALIFACLIGYVGLARFVSTQIILTGAVVSTIYIGILCGKAVAKRNVFAETQMGRYVKTRFRLGPVALDQAGLVAGLGIYAFTLLLGIPLILLFWGFQVRDLEQWAYRLFTEIKVGNISISLVGILGGIAIFAFGLLATRWLQKWLDGNVMERSQVDAGVRNSVKTGIGYLGVAVAGLIGISAAGLDLSSFALVAGALSLGVGFGLQNIVSNFVSGLILLVERPFKVGDWVVTGTTEGFVKRISVRATEIETFQRQSIMVPNSLFINASVGNWTHRNKLGRADIQVLVNYDSDPRRIMQLLSEIAEAHPLVLRNPAPMAVFSAFGEATMTFELRAFLGDIVTGATVRNDLRLAIFERFRAEGLGMPFKKEEVLPEAEVGLSEGSEEVTTAGPAPAQPAVVNAQSGRTTG